ncbi:MAG: hypothetical protein ABH885_03080 [Candidatus Omnitrophota bacterium]
MKDRKLEDNIKKTGVFLEFWTKFHELYRDAVSGNSPDREMFISTRSLVNSRFDELMDSLGVGSREKIDKCIPFYEILSIEDLSAMSDEKQVKIGDFWTDSYIYLYSRLDSLKRKKRRIEKFNRTVFMAKRLLSRSRQI